MKTYATIKQESRRLGISERHFRAMLCGRQIPSYKVGRRRLCVPQETDRALELKFRRGVAVPA